MKKLYLAFCALVMPICFSSCQDSLDPTDKPVLVERCEYCGHSEQAYANGWPRNCKPFYIEPQASVEVNKDCQEPGLRTAGIDVVIELSPQQVSEYVDGQQRIAVAYLGVLEDAGYDGWPVYMERSPVNKLNDPLDTAYFVGWAMPKMGTHVFVLGNEVIHYKQGEIPDAECLLEAAMPLTSSSRFGRSSEGVFVEVDGDVYTDSLLFLRPSETAVEPGYVLDSTRQVPASTQYQMRVYFKETGAIHSTSPATEVYAGYELEDKELSSYFEFYSNTISDEVLGLVKTKRNFLHRSPLKTLLDAKEITETEYAEIEVCSVGHGD